MAFVVEQPPTRKQFIANMENKLKDNEFITDMYTIIRPGQVHRIIDASKLCRSAALLPLPPLRTVGATFNAYSSDNSTFTSHKIKPAHIHRQRYLYSDKA